MVSRKFLCVLCACTAVNVMHAVGGAAMAGSPVSPQQKIAARLVDMPDDGKPSGALRGVVFKHALRLRASVEKSPPTASRRQIIDSGVREGDPLSEEEVVVKFEDA